MMPKGGKRPGRELGPARRGQASGTRSPGPRRAEEPLAGVHFCLLSLKRASFIQVHQICPFPSSEQIW